jgi:hypothetical protein
MVLWVVGLVILQADVDVSEENAASIVRVEVDFSPDDEGSMFLRNVGTCL